MEKHSVTIAGHATSITLEKEFWDELQTIAKSQGLSMSGLITEIDKNRSSRNLSSALRLYVLAYVKKQKAAGA